MRVNTALGILLASFLIFAAACSDDTVSKSDVYVADGGGADTVEADATVDGPLGGDTSVDSAPGPDAGVDSGAEPDSTVDGSAGGDSTVDGSASDTTVDSQSAGDSTVDTGADSTVDSGVAGYEISGSIAQGGGEVVGTQVFVRLYASNDVEDQLDHIAEQVVVAQEGLALSASDFTFRVSAPGTYYLRAFRDSAGPLGTAADGEPTLESDAQAPARQVDVVDTDISGVALLLRARTNDTDFYLGMNAFTFNESPLANPPRQQSGDYTIGAGFCGGYYMKLVAYTTNSTSTFLSALHAERPTGALARLVDDGGCDSTVADNSASSYDGTPNDGELGYGFAEPGDSDAGDYTFFYRQTEDDFIHIQSDTISQVVKLSTARYGQIPDGSSTLSQRRPTITWDAVPGAAFYQVLLFERGSGSGGWNNLTDTGNTVQAPSYRPSSNLPDDTCFSSLILAADASWDDDDPEAVALSWASFFCVDVDGQDSVTIQGSVDNRSNVAERVGVVVWTDTNGAASTWVPAGQSSYQLGVLSSGSAEVDAFVDADANGHMLSPGSQGRRAVTLDLASLQANVTGADLRINPALEPTAPDYWSTQAAPVLTWSDYVTTAGVNAPTTSGTLVLILDDVNNPQDVPLGMWLLAGDRTQLDLAQPPVPAESYDFLSMIVCMGNGGTPGLDASGNPTCSGGALHTSTTALQSGHGYYWMLQVIDCDFAAYNDASAFDFMTCFLNSTEEYAYSELRTFITP